MSSDTAPRFSELLTALGTSSLINFASGYKSQFSAAWLYCMVCKLIWHV